MKFKLLIVLSLVLAVGISAQELKAPVNYTPDSIGMVRGPKKLEIKEKEKKYAELFSWQINEYNLDTFRLPFDTASNDFYNYYPIYQNSIANAHLGNLGSPYQSMIYFDRPDENPFLFMDVYRQYVKTPEDYRYYNTKTPYTSLNYWTGGPKIQSEEQVRVIHSRNIGKDVNITGYGDYIYGRGFYDRLSTRHLKFSLSGSLLKPRYELYFVGGLNNLENFENGGFIDDRYIYNPIAITEDARGARDYNTFRVNLDDSRSKFNNRFLYINHEYKIGFKKDVVLEDTVIKEFVAVNTFGHTFKYNEYGKNYFEDSPDKTFYTNTFINDKGAPLNTQDSVSRRIIENTLKLYFEEGLNKYMPLGFGVFLRNEIIRDVNNSWSFIPDSIFNKGYSVAKSHYEGLQADSALFERLKGLGDNTYSNTSFGGHIYRRKGKNFFFNTGVEIWFLGYRQGDYRINGELTKWFTVLDSVSLTAKANFFRRSPDPFLNNYISNHFIWDNNFDDLFEQRIEGELKIPNWNAAARVKFNTIVNQIYYDSLATPKQFNSALPVLEITLLKDFKFGKMHWNNQLTYQATGNSEVLPLPDLALRSQLYYQNKAFDVLNLQIGLDAYFNTWYYAPAYMPATGRFYSQNERLIGNYPMVHAFANFQIKRMRFFLLYYHVHKDLIEPYHFSALHYGYNPRFLKIGVSWNFYD